VLAQIDNYNFYSALLIGFMSSAHCVVMCGGVASILSANIPLHHRNASIKLVYLLAYNAGRLFSYCMAGALLGYSFGFFALKSHLIFAILQLISGVMLVLVGLYVGQWLNIISYIERLGKTLWAYISPLAKRQIPFKSPYGAISFGLVWGWLPCGLVYSTLTWAAASGSSGQGALIMLGFGVGTLPAMFALGIVADTIKTLLQHRLVKHLSAILIIGFGIQHIYVSIANLPIWR